MSASISVIVPTYNRAEFIPACVESVLRNTVPDVEVIVVDDGSTDDTADVVQALDGPVHYIRQKNSGPAAARNHGFSRSQGRYVCFLDSDDAWLPSGAGMLFDALERHTGYGVAFGDTLMGNDESGWVSFIETYGGDAFRRLPQTRIHDDVACLENGAFFRQLAIRNVMFLGSLLLRRETFARSGGFHESLCGAADWDLFLRLAAHEPVLYASALPVSKYLKHDVGMSNDASHMNREFILALAHVLETADLSPVDRQHVRMLLRRHRFDWGYVAYDAGRLTEARQRFVEAVRESGPSTKALAYLLLCSAPPAVVRSMRAARRALAG